ncbi:hypothetical protein [Pseudomonas monachiensis]|uniref:Uncharacterized protein n=1 Tax=Pseudomonas monachiensis TaxID=3060212 RepID=A0ABW9HB37_9PSED
MAKHLTSKDINILVNLIDTWERKLGWEVLCDAAASLVGVRPPRQTLNSHAQIKARSGTRKNSRKQALSRRKDRRA